MDNTADLTMTGEGIDNYFGNSVSNAGDVNNDSYDDVIIGASGVNSNTGRIYIFYGSNSMDNTPDISITGEGIDNQFGFSVSGAGDVNNDSYNDIIVGAYLYPYNGKAYCYSIAEMFYVDIKVFLEGPYNMSNSNMDNNLTTTLPLTSPFSADPETVNDIPPNVVDWVLVELRDKNNSTSIIASESAFILKNGQIVDLDGVNPVVFCAFNDEYYISIKHRNHLYVMSANPQSLSHSE